MAALIWMTAAAAWAAPTLAGTNDRGDYGGKHYFEIYWTTDSGYVCSVPPSGPGGSGSYEMVTISPPPPVTVTYDGTSGYSEGVCQVNVAAPPGTGNRTMLFSYNSWSNGRYAAGPTQPGSVTLAF
ncbi:MAG TPA: hypothetical protein VMU17_01610 [Elusimicrobiota bacterium]|nr:hypothetical protein [Elusimicrobiota bacterium]